MRRWTETTKWTDRWFRRLDVTSKVFYLYLLDNCDEAGVWEEDFEMLAFHTGISICRDALVEDLGERLQVLEGEKILVRKFLPFQQPKGLKPNVPFHKKILERLEFHGLSLQAEKVTLKGDTPQGLGETPPNPYVNVNVNVKTVEGECEGETRKHPSEQIPLDLREGDFEEAWLEYLVHLDEIGHKRPGKTAVKAMFHKFRKHGVTTSARAIRHSIEQNYAGVFPETMTRNNAKGSLNDDHVDYDNPCG